MGHGDHLELCCGGAGRGEEGGSPDWGTRCHDTPRYGNGGPGSPARGGAGGPLLERRLLSFKGCEGEGGGEAPAGPQLGGGYQPELS